MNDKRRSIRRAFLVVGAVFLAASPALAQAAIVLDGQFSDWAGQPHVDDPQGDAQTGHTDLQAFYFATNPGVETAYFMAERWEAGAQPLNLVLMVDTNNNGVYTEAADRLVAVRYDPRPNDSRVDVILSTGQGTQIGIIAQNANWGEPQPGRRVEWGVSFADLGIQPFQNIRMTLVSLQGLQVSDTVAEVQWSPADALGWPLLAAFALLGVAWLVYRRRKTA